MIDNFFQQSYHSYDQVYASPETGNRIFLGDAQSAIDNDFHLNHKIRTVVTAAKNMEHIIVGEDITHITYPLTDAKHENIALFFERFFQLVEFSIKRGNMLVHCAAGISRSATLVISYLMRKEKLSFKEAISLIRKSRPNVLPNLGFERQLKRYEQALRSVKMSRNSKRSQARTSESGKSEASIKSQILPLVAPFSHIPPQNSQLNERMRRLADKFSQKDIQILRIYNNGRKNLIRNRINLLSKEKNLIGMGGKRIVKTEMFDEEGPFYKAFKFQNKLNKSKLLLEDLQQQLEQKRTDPFMRKLPTERGHTTDHLKKR